MYQSSKNAFAEDLKDAEIYENYVLEYFKNVEKRNIVKNTNSKKLKYCDLIEYYENSNKIKCLIEIKHDKYITHNGAIAVEFEYKGYPSGIETTKSPIFIFIDDNKVMYIFKTYELKNFIKNNIGKRNEWEHLLIEQKEVHNYTHAKFYRIELEYLKNIYTKIDIKKYINC